MSICNKSEQESLQLTYEVTKSPSYTGLNYSNPTFLAFTKDLLYQFPILDTQNQESEPIAFVSSKIVSLSRLINISQSLFNIHSASPFNKISKCADFTKFNFSNEAPVNSFTTGQELINLETLPDEASTSYLPVPQISQRSLTPSSYENFTPIIDSSAIRAIKGIHIQFIAKADEGVYRSITPESSFISETLTEKHRQSKYLNEGSFSRVSQLSVNNNEIIDWGSFISPRPSDVDELFLKSIVDKFKSEENPDDFLSFVDEGSIQPIRDFIPFESTASKNLLSSSKYLKPDLPNPLSPILSKMVVCQEVEDNESSLKIIRSMCFVGFKNSLSLEYSNIEAMNKAKVNISSAQYNKQSLFSEKILNYLCKLEVIYVSSGFEHCTILASNHKVYTWGYGSSGCLGHGNTSSLVTPTEVNTLVSIPISYIECGGHHTLAISSSHEVFMWGRGEVHQLGIHKRQLCKDEMGYVALKPIKVPFFASKGILPKSGACGESHTLVLDTEGKVYAFGWGEYGQLGVERNYLTHQMRTNEVSQVSLLPFKTVKVSAGLAFSAALLENGEVWVWGIGNYGQLGMGATLARLEHPSKVQMLNGEFVVDLVCGENSVVVLTATGKTFGWGQGKAGIFSSQDKSVQVGSEMICSFPRMLGEMDIVHHFVIGWMNRKVLSSLEYKEIRSAIEKRN